MIPRRRFLSGAGLAAGAMLTSAFTWPFQREAALVALLIAGNSRMLPTLTTLAAAFSREHPHVDVDCEGGGFYPALIALKRGGVDIAVLARDLPASDDQKGVRAFTIARDALAILVHPANPVQSLTRTQVVDILEGRILNWRAVGGPDAVIRVVDRASETSDDRADIEEVVLGHGTGIRASVLVDGDEGVAKAVAADPQAISFGGVEEVTGGLRALAIGGVPLERATLLSGRYPFSWPLNLVIADPSGEAELAFIDFARGAEGQTLLAKSGMTRLY